MTDDLPRQRAFWNTLRAYEQKFDVDHKKLLDKIDRANAQADVMRQRTQDAIRVQQECIRHLMVKYPNLESLMINDVPEDPLSTSANAVGIVALQSELSAIKQHLSQLTRSNHPFEPQLGQGRNLASYGNVLPPTAFAANGTQNGIQNGIHQSGFQNGEQYGGPPPAITGGQPYIPANSHLTQASYDQPAQPVLNQGRYFQNPVPSGSTNNGSFPPYYPAQAGPVQPYNSSYGAGQPGPAPYTHSGYADPTVQPVSGPVAPDYGQQAVQDQAKPSEPEPISQPTIATGQPMVRFDFGTKKPDFENLGSKNPILPERRDSTTSSDFSFDEPKRTVFQVSKNSNSTVQNPVKTAAQVPNPTLGKKNATSAASNAVSPKHNAVSAKTSVISKKKESSSETDSDDPPTPKKQDIPNPSQKSAKPDVNLKPTKNPKSDLSDDDSSFYEAPPKKGEKEPDPPKPAVAQPVERKPIVPKTVNAKPVQIQAKPTEVKPTPKPSSGPVGKVEEKPKNESDDLLSKLFPSKFSGKSNAPASPKEPKMESGGSAFGKIPRRQDDDSDSDFFA